ncbi:hypothetical protein [Phycicoccus sp. Soil748]|uniref:hypothetical protein n=1 Tax=Phycicoccus sp. Soil748 TaxID=1736397 RepID=UPI00070385A8|nr:hypothetical protein [Phycicoccus sp. Soil748]KRE58882.1 hypothetical protein ASG70_16695 [Phycicoccus sp. Soil748]
MQPSSLVFLVIIAVWAAYFVQYWVRRREHLATARSVDQFSESMRVLERRTALPVADLSVPSPRSYAVSPARAVRAQVLVKRAETTTFTMTATPGATTRPAPSADLEAVEGLRDGAWGWEEPAPAPGKAGRDTGHELAPAAVRPARKVRGLTLLASLAAVLLALPLAAFGALPWVAVLVPVAAVVGSVAWVRQAVAAEQAARRASRPTAERPGAQRPAPRAAAVPTAPRRPVEREQATRPAASSGASTQLESHTESHTESEPDDTVTEAPAQPAASALYDFQEVERGLAAPATAAPAAPQPTPAAAVEPAAELVVPARPLVDEDDIPLTWDPVPVPRPTYTMKSRATRPAPTAADLVGDADTEYAAYEQEPARRVAGA